MLDAAATEDALANDSVALSGVRDVIVVDGPDAAEYLQGQISQDVERLAIGDSAWSLVLQPQGKVDGWFRITRVAEDLFWLDLDEGRGEAVLARLERFKLRTKADLTLERRPWLAVRGPASSPPEGVRALPVDWPGVDGFDLLGPDADSVAKGRPGGDSEAFEAFRIRHGIPLSGKELTEKTIPAEAGVVDGSVSFTKGCYVGQELVARIDSRGNNTPRNLAGVVISGRQMPDEGAVLMVEGGEVGTITSAALSNELGPVALAYVRRGTEVPGPASVDLPSGESVNAELRSLPF